MKCLGIFCCAIVGLMVSAAEEIADLRLGSHASLSGQVLSIAPPGGVDQPVQPSVFRINLSRHAGSFVMGAIKVKSSLKTEGADAGVMVRVSYRAEDDSHDRLGGKFFKPGELLGGAIEFPVSLDPHVQWGSVSLECRNVSGRIEFDLESLAVSPLFPKDDSSYRCEYSAAVLARPLRRGVMSPVAGADREENFAELKKWNVDLMRLQINIGGNPADYPKHLASYLDVVVPRVLDLGAKYGIMVIIDLHMVPGGGQMRGGETIFDSEKSAQHFFRIWEDIASRFKDHPALYGYDLFNEPSQSRPAKYSYWDLQRIAAERIRKIDPETPIYVESNHLCSPLAYCYLQPLKLKNIIYQVHFYEPFDYTHFMISRQKLLSGEVGYRSFPGVYYGTLWGPDLVEFRKKLAMVRDFEERHGAKIFVGEFSTQTYAPGAAQYLDSCIRLFEEYGWDWTYHAFREARIWDVEYSGSAADALEKDSGTLSKAVLLKAFARNGQDRSAGENGGDDRPAEGEGATPKPSGDAAAAEGLSGWTWINPEEEAVQLWGDASLDGGKLVCAVPEDQKDTGAAGGACSIDLTPYRNCEIELSIRARAEDVARPKLHYMGIKFMLKYQGANGKWHYPECNNLAGSFERELAVRHLVAADAGPALIAMQLAKASGKITYDLSTLRIRVVSRKRNPDLICRYSEAVRSRPVHRGVMSPCADADKEENFAELKKWNVNLMRFQINIGGERARDPDFYQEHIRRYIDHSIPRVLDLGAKYGIMVILDLHMVPGGGQMREGKAIFDSREDVERFCAIWEEIATKFKGHPALYGYDLFNEPRQTRPAEFDFWEIQRLAAERIRRIDPETPIYVQSNMLASQYTFDTLSPIDLDNIIYEVHCYDPFVYTHTPYTKADRLAGKPRFAYPGKILNAEWNAESIKSHLGRVIDFAEQHQAKIYVGEFSARAGSPGAAQYLRDSITVFEELGWDWTYHAFREAKVWSVEHDGASDDELVPVPDTDRKQVLLEAFRKNLRSR